MKTETVQAKADVALPTPPRTIPMGQKVAYGVGQLGNSMFPAALGVFMVVLVQGLGMPPLLWGIVFFLPRVWAAVIDPLSSPTRAALSAPPN